MYPTRRLLPPVAFLALASVGFVVACANGEGFDTATNTTLPKDAGTTPQPTTPPVVTTPPPPTTPTPVIQPGAHRRMFITNATFDGNLGGNVGADQKCQAAADAVPLGGKFQAWISQQGKPAPAHIQGLGPWYEVGTDKEMFASDVALQQSPYHSPTADEHGAYIAHGWWTGTHAGGEPGSAHCNNWTSNVDGDFGIFGASLGGDTPGTAWTEASNNGRCDDASKLGLLCFEE